MSHAITIGDVAMVVGAIAAIVAVGAIALVLIIVMNPFRSGH